MKKMTVIVVLQRQRKEKLLQNLMIQEERNTILRKLKFSINNDQLKTLEIIKKIKAYFDNKGLFQFFM